MRYLIRIKKREKIVNSIEGNLYSRIGVKAGAETMLPTLFAARR